MSGPVPGDEGWREDSQLVGALSTVNYQLRMYILRYFDVDAGQATPISSDDEHALGLRLVDLGEVLQRRAVQRKVQAAGPGPGLEVEGAQPQALEPGRERDMDSGP